VRGRGEELHGIFNGRDITPGIANHFRENLWTLNNNPYGSCENTLMKEDEESCRLSRAVSE
jgi:hypothetical protein